MSTVIKPPLTCVYCLMEKQARPFTFPLDNEWLDARNAHRGCARRRDTENSAKKGFGIDSEKDDTAGEKSSAIIPLPPQEAERGSGEETEKQEGPDPDFQV